MIEPRHLCLHHLESFRGDDGRVALLHEVAGDLPSVLHHLLREEVRREGLVSMLWKPHGTRLHGNEEGGAFAPPRQGFCTPCNAPTIYPCGFFNVLY